MRPSVTIIGAGPAGIAAAIQLKRCGIEPVLFEGDEIGGLLRNALLVENYPGFPEGISGESLVNRFRRQITLTGVQVVQERVERLDHDGVAFSILTDHGQRKAETVIVATGTRPRVLPDMPVPAGVRDRVVYEVHGIRHIEGKHVAIIGAGDVACDYALTLSARNKVMILSRSERPSCVEVLWKRCNRDPHISFFSGCRVGGIRERGDRMVLEFADPGDVPEPLLQTDLLLVAIGREPRLDVLGESVAASRGRLAAEKKLYFIGDVTNMSRRQTAICVGDGLRAAMDIHDLLENPLHENGTAHRE